MASERGISIQFNIPPDDVPQFKEYLELTGLKPIEFVRSFALECAHFVIQEASRGAEVIGVHPDGTQRQMLTRVVGRVRRNATKKSS